MRTCIGVFVRYLERDKYRYIILYPRLWCFILHLASAPCSDVFHFLPTWKRSNRSSNQGKILCITNQWIQCNSSSIYIHLLEQIPWDERQWVQSNWQTDRNTIVMSFTKLPCSLSVIRKNLFSSETECDRSELRIKSWGMRRKFTGVGCF